MYKGSGAKSIKGMHRPEAAGNFDNMDDFNIVDSVDTNTGTIQHTPSNEKDIVNKEYVDSIATRSEIELFLTENASDIGTYFDLETNVVTAAEETIAQTITANSTTLIASFASILDEPEIDAMTLLESGIYGLHLHAEAAVAKGMRLYFEFYHRTAGGTETLIGTSHDTAILTTTEEQYEVHASVTNDTAFVAGDRIVIKVYGRNNTAANRTITIHMEGDTAARVEFPGFIEPGALNLWTRAGTVLSPKTAGDNVETTGAGVFEGLNPYNNGTADLGSGAFKWRSLILSENITLTGNITLGGTVDGVDIAARDHAESHSVASHNDTTGTGAELDTLTDNSMADALHRHSELSASDGTPDQALVVSATGDAGIGTTPSATRLDVLTDVDGNFAGRFINSHATGSYGVSIQAGDDSGNYALDVANKDGTSYLKVRGDGNILMENFSIKSFSFQHNHASGIKVVTVSGQYTGTININKARHTAGNYLMGQIAVTAHPDQTPAAGTQYYLNLSWSYALTTGANALILTFANPSNSGAVTVTFMGRGTPIFTLS